MLKWLHPTRHHGGEEIHTREALLLGQLSHPSADLVHLLDRMRQGTLLVLHGNWGALMKSDRLMRSRARSTLFT